MITLQLHSLKWNRVFYDSQTPDGTRILWGFVMRTTPCHSAHHVVLFCLYLPCRPNASVSVYCRDKDFATCGAVFVPRWENWNRWLCLIWAYKSVVLSFFFLCHHFQTNSSYCLASVAVLCVFCPATPTKEWNTDKKVHSAHSAMEQTIQKH